MAEQRPVAGLTSGSTETLRESLSQPGLDDDLDVLAMTEEVRALAHDRGAIILAHNYQRPEVQDVADFVGDSLELARKAASVPDASVIVFCGVHFMAETAAILNPEKPVVLPDIEAGCPLADMVTPRDVEELKRQYPGAPVVSYVNTSADVKAVSDICCTSSNAVSVVRSLAASGADTVIFVPDKHLAAFVARKVPDVRIVPGNGFCPTHARFSLEDVARAREEHPEAVVVCHPECVEDVQLACDYVLSTGGMARLPSEVTASEFVVGTEVGMLYRLRTMYPECAFYPLNERAICPNMKKITLPRVLHALTTLEPIVTVPDETARLARSAIERMLEIR